VQFLVIQRLQVKLQANSSQNKSRIMLMMAIM